MSNWFKSFLGLTPSKKIPVSRKPNHIQDTFYPKNRGFAQFRDPVDDADSENIIKPFNPDNNSQFDIESDKSDQVSVVLPGLPIITAPRNSSSTESLNCATSCQSSQLPPTPIPSPHLYQIQV